MIFKKNMAIKYFFVIALIFLNLLAWYIDESQARAGRTSRSSSKSYSSRSSSYRGTSASRSYSSYSKPYTSSSSYSGSYSRPYSSGYGGSNYYGRRSYSSSYGSSGYYSGGSSSMSFFTIFIIIAFFGVAGLVIYLIYKALTRGQSQYSYGADSYSYGSDYNTYGSSSQFSRQGSGLEPFDSDYNSSYNISNPQLEQRIHDVFMVVQNAWSSRNPFIAQRYMSDRLFREHSADINDMISRGERNVMENIKIHQIRIVEATANFVKAYITASMIDYYVNEYNGQIIDGSNEIADEFTELWCFVKTSDGFVVDEISE
ncbi:MAG: Tim44-like domain-containing protein [Candidatus Wallbacteria bacterium]